MYETPGKPPRISQLAIRKSPSLPMLDIAIIGADASGTESFSKCPLSSGRKALPTTPLLHRKLKSAASLCMGILVCTIVLFVLVALDPSKVTEEPWRGGPRMRVSLPSYRHWSNHANAIERDPLRNGIPKLGSEFESGAALEGMGMLFRRGTRGMPHLVVAHLAESTSVDELRLFLRGLHRSGVPAHADVVLLFPFRPVATEFLAVIRDEDNFFQKLVAIESSQPRAPDAPVVSLFNRGAYTRTPPPVAAELTSVRQDSIWGRRHNDTTRPSSKKFESPDLQPAVVAHEVVVDETPHYGAVVGFDVQELDPDDALSGFLHSSPMHLRRWLCYQMLLGMVRHKYRHVLVTEVTGVVILTDALLANLKKKDASQLHLYATAQTWSQTSHSNSSTNSTMMEAVYGSGIWNSLEDDEKMKKLITTGVILGGVRPVRIVTTAMATEIVRVALLRKSRESFSDEALLSFLVHKSSALGRKVASHLHVHESGTSAVNLLPSSQGEFFSRNESRFAVIQGLQNESVSGKQRQEILESLRRDICQAQSDREVYTDCYTEAEMS